MRMIGQVNGARSTTATRRSVMRSCDGLELRLTFWTAPSRSASVRIPADAAPAASPTDLKKERRPISFSTQAFMFFLRVCTYCDARAYAPNSNGVNRGFQCRFGLFGVRRSAFTPRTQRPQETPRDRVLGPSV